MPAPLRMDAGWTVVLSWPDKVLSPNARCHWSAKARAVKKTRRDAFYAAREAGAWDVGSDALALSLTFYPPDSRARDADNLIASCKPLLDGIADATGVNDSRFHLDAVRFGEVVKHGQVRVELRRTA